VGKTGRFGPFVGCSRYPDCTYIKKDGPPPPERLPFDVVCPKNGDGTLVARRARRTGNVFWGCSAYPKCDFTTNFEPVGAIHDADDGPVARKDDSGICLRCGADIRLPDGDLVGVRLAGGPPNPEALARPARGGARGGRRGGPGGGGRGRGAGGGRAPGSRAAPRRTRPTESAPDA
jgi:ssDNA-binding Zn-finger/Zn-ribbon topoisomerase 1